MNVHLRTQAVYNETMKLRAVTDEYLAENDVRHHNVAIIGDYNFDCGYISGVKRNEVRAKLTDYTWYISDKVKTTISTQNCAYDRIIVRGDDFNRAVVPFTNRTYRYDLEWDLPLAEVIETRSFLIILN